MAAFPFWYSLRDLHRSSKSKVSITQLDLDPRQQQCVETITDYDYGISYTLGKDNVMADALSRKSYCNNHMTYKTQPLQDDLTYKEHLIRVLIQIKCHSH